MVYLDNAATSFPKPDGLGEFIGNFISSSSVNINRGIYSLSSDLSNLIIDTRIKFSNLFHMSGDLSECSKRVIFTSGITMSLNMFLRGLLKENDHIIVSSFEHHSVMRTLYDLKDKKNISFSLTPFDENGILKTDEIENLINENTKAILINHSSNVFGSINDIEKVGKIAKEHNLYFAVDAAQTAGVIDIDVEKCNIDFLAFPGHKGLLGLPGVGGFIISKSLSETLEPIITGGTGAVSNSYYQPNILPDKFESGTLNLIGILSLNYTLDYINNIGIENIREHEIELRTLFVDELSKFEGITVYCKDIRKEDTVGTVSISFDDIDNSKAAYLLSDKYEIMVREGFHCAYSAHESMKTTDIGTIRFSFGHKNTREDVMYAVNSIIEILNDK